MAAPPPVASPTPSAATADTAPGPQRYGRYILIDRLGAGGMAEVFRALVIGPEDFQRIVVVKRILPHLSENPSFIKMFISEATLCGRLSHPNIIQVHEFGKSEGQYFIAMEYLQGRTISSMMSRLALRQEHMPVTVAAEIARQACQGLAYAHGLTSVDGKPLGIIHRDITPSNVMVAHTGAVKVLDFGIARVTGAVRSGNTDPGQVKGKSSYLAPEQIKIGIALDNRVDVFATGIVLHEMLAGRRLFKAAGPIETMKMIQDMDIPPPSKLNPAVPARIDAIVMKALRRNRDERWRDAADMAEELEGYLIEQKFASQELPRFLRGLFKEELSHEMALPPTEELRALMDSAAASEATVKSVTSEMSGGTSDGRAASADLVEAVPQPMPDMVSLSVENLVDEAVDDAAGLFPDGRKRLMIAGAIGGAVVLAIVILVATSGPSKKPAAPVATTEAAAVETAATPAPALSPEVRISLSSEPEGATVKRVGDSQALGITPLSFVLPRGAAAVELEVTLAGHVTGVIRVVPDDDKPALVTLAQAAEPAASPSTGDPGTVRAPRPRTRQVKVRNAIPIDPFK